MRVSLRLICQHRFSADGGNKWRVSSSGAAPASVLSSSFFSSHLSFSALFAPVPVKPTASAAFMLYITYVQRWMGEKSRRGSVMKPSSRGWEGPVLALGSPSGSEGHRLIRSNTGITPSPASPADCHRQIKSPTTGNASADPPICVIRRRERDGAAVTQISRRRSPVRSVIQLEL